MAKQKKKWRLFNKKRQSDAAVGARDLKQDGAATRPLDVNNNKDDNDASRKGKIGLSWLARKGGKKAAHQTAVVESTPQNETFTTAGTEESAFAEEVAINSNNNGNSFESHLETTFPDLQSGGMPIEMGYNVRAEHEQAMIGIFDAGFPEGVETTVPPSAPWNVQEEPSNTLDAPFSKFHTMPFDDGDQPTALAPRMRDPVDLIAPDTQANEGFSDVSPEIQGFLSSAQEQQMGIDEANDFARRKAIADNMETAPSPDESAFNFGGYNLSGFGLQKNPSTVTAGTSVDSGEAPPPPDSSSFSLGFNLPSAFMLQETYPKATVHSADPDPPSDASAFSFFNIPDPFRLQGLASSPAAAESLSSPAEPSTMDIRHNPTDVSKSEESRFSDAEEFSIEAKIRTPSELAANTLKQENESKTISAECPEDEQPSFSMAGLYPDPATNESDHTQPLACEGVPYAGSADFQIRIVTEQKCRSSSFPARIKALDTMTTSEETLDIEDQSGDANVHRERSHDAFDSWTSEAFDAPIHTNAVNSTARTYSDSPRRQQAYDAYDKIYELSLRRERASMQTAENMLLDEVKSNDIVREEDIDSLQYSTVEDVLQQQSIQNGVQSICSASPGVGYNDQVQDGIECRVEFVKDVVLNATDDVSAVSLQDELKDTFLIQKRTAERRGDQMSPSTLSNPGVPASKEIMGDQDIAEPISDHRSDGLKESDEDSPHDDRRLIPRFSSVFDRVPTDLENVGIPRDVDSYGDEIAEDEGSHRSSQADTKNDTAPIRKPTGEEDLLMIKSKLNEDDSSVHSASVISEVTAEGRRRKKAPSFSFIAAGLNITGLDRFTNNLDCSFLMGDTDGNGESDVDDYEDKESTRGEDVSIMSYTDYDAYNSRGAAGRSRIEEEVEDALEWADENVLFCGGNR